jgi:nanoRNase/pAp phosphatase (c-di-AMP/oligoRNAs hydrolase)
MADRLVLGCSSLGQTIVGELAGRPGGVRVVTDDENRAETLVADGVPVTVGDPTAVGTLRALDPPGVVVVAGEDPGDNVAAAQVARQAFPGAVVIAYTGRGAAGHAAKLDAIADRVVDPGREVASFLLDRIGDDATRLWHLQRVLRGIDRLAIVAHDNPDPDAIASAVALARLAGRVGCEPEVCYYGDITHQENRAFVNLLGFDLQNLDPDADLSAYDGFALVDHSRPGVNDQLPEDLPVDVVIDHHPPRGPVEATFVDLRSGVGATSTLLVDYLDNLGVPFTEELATGLLFGVRVDTDGFTRETSRADFEAAATLLPHANLGTLERVGSPSISPATFETIADAIANRRQEGQVVITGVGRLSDRDALAQAADRLLALEGVTTTVVYGVRDGTVYVSARARGIDLDLGETLRDAFGSIGSAGGHADMAGAQIALGVLETVEDMDESLLEVVGSVVADRFFEALEARSPQPEPGVYADDHGADRYLVPSEERPVLESDASPDTRRREPGADGDGA